ncbi:hypothetical protein ACNKHO_22300 [Shigella flexneri]
MVNQDLRQQLSQDMALILLQPNGEPEFDMKELKDTWNQIMDPSAAASNVVRMIYIRRDRYSAGAVSRLSRYPPLQWS